MAEGKTNGRFGGGDSHRATWPLGQIGGGQKASAGSEEDAGEVSGGGVGESANKNWLMLAVYQPRFAQTFNKSGRMSLAT